jgi:NADH-quinone oxidoreductase subunit M
MNWLNSYGLTLATFIPLAGAALLLLVKSRELAKLVALLCALVVLGITSWLGYEYRANPGAHPTAATVLKQRADEALSKLAPPEKARVEAELAKPRMGTGESLRQSDAEYAAYAEVKELRLATQPAESEHLRFVEYHPWIPQFRINYFLAADGLSMPLIWLTALLTVICLLYSWNMEKLPRGYFGLFLVLETGLIGVFAALDLFLFYVFWEVVLLPMYFLIGIWGGPRRIYASIKFFIYTLVGSVVMLIAFLYMYFAFEPHTFNTLALTSLVPTLARGVQYWLFAGLFLGFAIKVPVFPFHTWLPDAHVEAPTAASMVLAGILLKMGVYGFYRFLYPLVPGAALATSVVWLIAILGMINLVYGALVAMAQTDFKSLVAYSSISAMGYCLLGLASMNAGGLMGGALQSFNHGIESPLLFCLVGVVYERAHHRNLNDFGGLGLQMPYYTGLAIVGFMAALGLPGLNMFIGEAITFLGAYQPTSLVRGGAGALAGIGATWIVYVSLAGIVFTAAYVLWTIQRVFFGPIKEKYLHFEDLNGREVVSLVPLCLLCIAFGVFPSLLIDYMKPSLEAIMQVVQSGALVR